ncbi:MAG: NAD(P)/FAD-dependent oxidoreductase [Promethearchaeota archaeon]
MKRLNVIIIGAGFAGFRLAKKIEKFKNFDILLINPSHHFLYNPLLHEASVGQIPKEVPFFDIKKELKRAWFIRSSVIKIYFNKKEIELENSQFYKYDYLIISPGASPLKVIEGSENYPTMKTIFDAIRINSHLKIALGRYQPLISVIGGGAVGIELASEIASLAKTLKKEIFIDLFVAEKQFFPSIPKFHSIIDKQLKKLNINILYNEKVLKIEKNIIYTENAEYPSEFIVICIGSRPVLINSDLQFKRAYRVNQFCQVEGIDDVYSIGDAANFPYLNGNAPMLAQVAKIQADYLSKLLVRKIKGKKLKPLQLKPIKFMFISLGKNYGVAHLLNHYVIRGIIAWLLKRTYYVYDLFRYKKDFRLIKSYFISSLFHNYYFRIEHNLL